MPKALRYGTGLLTGFLLLVVTVYLIEKPLQEAGFDFLDALAMMLFLLGGEVGGTEPVTTLGRLLWMLTFVLGVGLVVVIIGNVAARIIQRKKEAVMHPDTEDHIVICGWNNRGDRIIRELHAPDAEPGLKICVITDTFIRKGTTGDFGEEANEQVSEKQLREAHPDEYENVYFVSQDPTEHSTLKQQRAHKARSVIILIDENSPDPDGRTALIALAISNLERESDSGYRPHMVAEVRNHRKIQHLKDAGVDEWVCAYDFGLGILAQAALSHKITEVYHHLLSHHEDTNEIYMVKPQLYPEKLVGMRFGEVSNLLDRNRQVPNPVLLLGVKRGDKLLINPRRNELNSIESGDILVVMAYTMPNLMYLADEPAGCQ